jgi:hypothetical protein
MHYLEGAHQSLVNRHHSTSIVKLSTVIWSREKGDQLTLGKEFIPILHNLFRNKINQTFLFLLETATVLLKYFMEIACTKSDLTST